MNYRVSTLIVFLGMTLMLTACGASKKSTANQEMEPAWRLQHQILFTFRGEEKVFEGYMILTKEAFLVKAFAGPGVDLFTVVRDRERHREVLHLDSLADRIDVTRIGEDIRRIYLAWCPGETKPQQWCSVNGEQLVVSTNPQGRVSRKHFPSAHGVGLYITYKDTIRVADRELPKRIELVWGDGTFRMVILLTAAERVTDLPADFFDRALLPDK